jgi:oligopeptide/dipeptide ABC transporter ATP-binding protein
LPIKARAGGSILAAFCIVAIVGPYLAPYDPTSDIVSGLQAPSVAHLLGTTMTGQDVLSEVLVGTRATMVVAFAAGALATCMAALIGVAAGFLAGLWDESLSLLTNVFLVLPALPLLIVLLSYKSADSSLGITLVLSMLGWPYGARLIRAQTLSLRRRDFITAARETGERRRRILWAEILPNVGSLIAVTFVGSVLYAISAEVALAFLGLTPTSQWSLGTILYWAQTESALQLGAWWWFVPPGVFVALIGAGLVLLNMGLDELINPRLRDTRRGTATGGRSWRPTDPTVVAPDIAAHSIDVARHGIVSAGVTRSESSAPVTGSPQVEPSQLLLEVRGFSITYRSTGGAVGAVRDVDLTLHSGEIVGLAGESGSGKSTLAYGLCRLLRPPAVIEAGSVNYRGRRSGGARVDLLACSPDELRELRWSEVAVVFQSAMNALNPVMRVSDQLIDAIDAHVTLGEDAKVERVERLIDLVGIPRDRMGSYPHELSGGMRQRVMIAMALVLYPEIVIMDEPTTALDVVVQREILSQIIELQSEMGFAVLFITHDLSVLAEMATRIAVMYGGRVVEVGSTTEMVERPAHPYTRALLRSFPSLWGPKRALAGIPGSPPDLRNPSPGCPFVPRCKYAAASCTEVAMSLLPVSAGEAGHVSACPVMLSPSAEHVAEHEIETTS